MPKIGFSQDNPLIVLTAIAIMNILCYKTSYGV